MLSEVLIDLFFPRYCPGCEGLLSAVSPPSALFPPSALSQAAAPPPRISQSRLSPCPLLPRHLLPGINQLSTPPHRLSPREFSIPHTSPYLCSQCAQLLFRPPFWATPLLADLDLGVDNWAINFYHQEPRKLILATKYRSFPQADEVAFQLGYYQGWQLNQQPKFTAKIRTQFRPGPPGVLVVPAPSQPIASKWRPSPKQLKPYTNPLVGAFTRGWVAGANQIATTTGQRVKSPKIPFFYTPFLAFSEPKRETGKGGSVRERAVRRRSALTIDRQIRADFPPKMPVLVIDDVITTGATIKAMVDCIRGGGDRIIGIFSLLLAKNDFHTVT